MEFLFIAIVIVVLVSLLLVVSEAMPWNYKGIVLWHGKIHFCMLLLILLSFFLGKKVSL